MSRAGYQTANKMKELVLYFYKVIEFKSYLGSDVCTIQITSNDGLNEELEWECEGCLEPRESEEKRLEKLENIIKESFEKIQKRLWADSKKIDLRMLYNWRIKLNSENDFFGKGNAMGMCQKKSEEEFTSFDRELIKKVLRKVNPKAN